MPGAQLLTAFTVTYAGMVADDCGFNGRVLFPEDLQQVETDPAAQENVHQYDIGLCLLHDGDGFTAGTGLEDDTDIFEFLQEAENFIDDQ